MNRDEVYSTAETHWTSSLVVVFIQDQIEGQTRELSMTAVALLTR